MKFSEDILIYFKAFFHPVKSFTVIISGVFPCGEAWEKDMAEHRRINQAQRWILHIIY